MSPLSTSHYLLTCPSNLLMVPSMLLYFRNIILTLGTVSADTIVMCLWRRWGSQSLELNGKQNCLDQWEWHRHSHNRTLHVCSEDSARIQLDLTISDQKYDQISISYCIQSLSTSLYNATPLLLNSSIYNFLRLNQSPTSRKREGGNGMTYFNAQWFLLDKRL